MDHIHSNNILNIIKSDYSRFDTIDEVDIYMFNKVTDTSYYINVIRPHLINSIDKFKPKDINIVKQINNIDYNQITVLLDDSNDEQNNNLLNDSNDEPNNNPLNDSNDDLLDDSDNKYLRKNQLIAIDNTIKQGFKSGIHCQIMGAGKSLIILKTINEHFKLYKCNKIYVVMTERIDILKQLFFSSDQSVKQEEWKINDIIDMDLFDIKENIIAKDYKLNTFDDITKPIIWIINNAYLKTVYKNIDYNKIGLMLNDECHSVSGQNNYNMMKHFRDNNIEIIGFSATPLRPIKNIDIKLKNIFGDENGKLNLISSYSLFDGIRDDIILPFYHIIVEIDDNDENKYKNIIDKYILENEDLPYKKGIGWSKRIKDLSNDNLSDDNILGELSKCFNSSDNILTYHSKNNKEYDENGNNSLDKFHNMKPSDDNNNTNINSLLLCVNCCREGSDIQCVDYGIFLDRVQKRSILVSLQTCGRIMRPDKDGKKKYAYIIEFVDKDKKIEVMTINKVMSYYKSILCLCDNDDIIEYMDDKIVKDFEKLYNNTYIIRETNEIKIKVPNNENNKLFKECTIKLETQIINWSIFKSYLKREYIKITGKTEYEILRNEYEKFRIDNQNIYKIETKTEYQNKIQIYDLELEPEKKYNMFWSNWYNYLGIDISKYPSNKSLWKKKCEKLKLSSRQKYNNYVEQKNDMPKMPEELYKIKNLMTEFDKHILI
jgi:superfamily II DNA or RNA helicase